MKKVVSLLLVFTVLFTSLVFTSVTANAGSTIESALSWALNIANDDSHRYVLGASHSENEGTNYDCSSFVSWAFRHAGLNVPISTTYVMRQNFEPYGFVWIPWSSIGGTSNLQRGDILLDESTHVEFYYGNNQMLGAHNPNSGISVYGYYNNAYGVSWDGVLRYNEPPIGYDPTSYLDSVIGGVGTVSVKGWTFDRDDLTQSLNIHVYIGGSLATPDTEGHSLPANVSRRDVDNVHHVGEFHGFDATIPTTKTGNVEVYVYAINIGGGSNVEIGHQTVYISPDVEQPHGNTPWIDCVTQDSFCVNIAPTDNVGIKNVRVATWTHNQDDLIWHEALYNGDGVYYLNVERSDYSNSKNSFYNNHFYVYDYSGNYISVACNQDYKITSETGKNIPEGEYRIATAVNNDRYLDVAGGSSESGENIQIYANSLSPKQTFRIIYNNNGFYKISNTYSKCLVDVIGDTYLNNTNVAQITDNSGANQEWMFKPTGNDDGYYYIIAHSNGLALDVTNALDQDGANVAVYTQNQTIAQKWKLRRVLNDSMISVNDVTINSNTDEILPEITVKVDNEIIPQNGNYQVEIITDIEKGKGTVTVTGIDKYCDSVTKEFNISKELIILGDADGNGKVNASDTTFIQRYLTGFSVSYPKETLMNADVDGNGILTILDATLIQRYLAKIDTPYPIGEPKT